MTTWKVQLKDTLMAETVEADSFMLDEGAWFARKGMNPSEMVAAFNAEQVVSIVRQEPVVGETRAVGIDAAWKDNPVMVAAVKKLEAQGYVLVPPNVPVVLKDKTGR